MGQDLLGLQNLLFIAFMIKTSIQHALGRIENWRLFQHTHPKVATEDDLARIVTLHPRKDGEQCRLTRTVLGNQSYLLSFGNGETDVTKQYQRAKRLRQLLYV